MEKRPAICTYRVRPGLYSDVSEVVKVWNAAFAKDQLMDILFPGRQTHPELLLAQITRLFYSRYWTPNYDLHVLVSTTDDKPVGLTWWKRPDSQLSIYERWISPSAWASPIVHAWYWLRNKLFPIPNLDQHAAETFARVFTDIEPKLRTTSRRRDAWYLSTLAVEPSLQGNGLGSMLLNHGLERVDKADVAGWLIGLEGIDRFYERHGFVTVERANVGELGHWNGGSIMFRKDAA
ncbi:acyl-CoA N-acyltransferase [Fusarium flagelliforme]|uniref:acyl-CoA N-acyltransferase n=1 Tax=Fusarium flagelliforme TaxID=2675880 RepID=UPI001E8D1D8A|nr:acyl-CoA N-acyltransferase [Fusarium flagelliforme]KAH7184970.1 acyl-CoA N-acyltransferase [Fusarium flagelliforme]